MGTPHRISAGIRLIFLSVVFVAIGLDIPDKERFFGLVSILMAYIAFEVYFAGNDFGDWRWINPVVLSSVVTFGILFGASNFGYLVFGERTVDTMLGGSAYHWMSRAMLQVFVAVFGMWLGYRAFFGESIAAEVTRTPFFQRALRRGYEINWVFVFVLLAISLTCRMTQISVGVFGYGSEPDRLEKLAGFTQYLSIGADLGKLALAAAALAYFRRGPERGILPGGALLLLLAYETGFGFLSGFKSQVVIPCVIAGVCCYCARGKFPKGFLPATALLIVVSYQVIEPFRAMRHFSPDFQGRDILRIGLAVAQGQEAFGMGDSEKAEFRKAVLEAFAGRISYLPNAARLMQFESESGIPEGSPDFLGNMISAPLHAVVPRLLWPEKPTLNVGKWYSVEILGDPVTSTTAVAMTPVGYLFLAGGSAAVLAGFYLLGILQRTVFECFRPDGSGGALILLGTISQFAILESSFESIFISAVRMLPVLLLGQYLIYRK